MKLSQLISWRDSLQATFSPRFFSVQLFTYTLYSIQLYCARSLNLWMNFSEKFRIPSSCLQASTATLETMALSGTFNYGEKGKFVPVRKVRPVFNCKLPDRLISNLHCHGIVYRHRFGSSVFHSPGVETSLTLQPIAKHGIHTFYASQRPSKVFASHPSLKSTIQYDWHFSFPITLERHFRLDIFVKEMGEAFRCREKRTAIFVPNESLFGLETTE